MRISLVFVAFSLGVCTAQQVAVGLKAGARLTGDIDSYDAQSESKRYLLGPAVELALPLRFSVEVDALYHRTGFRTAFSNFGGGYQAGYRANEWEFPMLLKYRLPFPAVRPFVEVGYAPRYLSGSYQSIGYSVDLPTGAVTHSTGSGKWSPGVSHGVVAGGGIEFGGRHLRLAPEIRYTRWNSDPINFYGSGGYFVSASPGQVDLLVGIWWRR